MRRFALACVGASSMLCVSIHGVSSAQPESLFRVGTEFQVNTHTEEGQRYATVARGGDGKFAVVWTGNGPIDPDVFARRYSVQGVPLGSVFQVNTYTPSSHRIPAIAFNASGRFVVAYTSAGQDDSGLGGVFAQIFDEAGEPLGAEFQVNLYTEGFQAEPAVTYRSDGSIVVAFVSSEAGSSRIIARRFGSSGQPLTNDFQVSQSTVQFHLFPSIGADGAGGFVVAWHRQVGVLPATFYAPVFRRFDSNDNGGPETQVPLFSAIDGDPKVGVEADGDFVVTWNRSDTYQVDTIARRFDSAGSPKGPDFLINSVTEGLQLRASVAVEADGDFMIVWDSQDQDGDATGVFAQAFDAGGDRIGVELQVNSYTSSHQYAARVAAGKGGYVVVWDSPEQDGSAGGVFAQRFATLGFYDVDGNGQFEPLTDGLLILRFGFGFTGQTLISGAVAPDCTRCDAVAIADFLDSMI